MANNVANNHFAAATGNAVEAYDLFITTYMAPFMSLSLLPPETDPFSGLVNFFLIFFVGILARPAFATISGALSDVLGRKAIMFLSVLLTGCSTILIAAIPDYSSLGLLSVLLFLMLRLTQSASMSGEYTNSIAFLVEHSRDNRRGQDSYFAGMGWNVGNLLAALVTLIMVTTFSSDQMVEFGWRVPFLLALPGIALSYFVRRNAQETLAFIKMSAYEDDSLETYRQKVSQVRSFLAANLKRCVLYGTLVWCGVSATFLVFAYGPTHAGFHEGGVGLIESLWLVILSFGVLIPAMPIFGRLMDKYDEEKLLFAASLLIALTAYPYFWILSHGTFPQLILVQTILAIACSCFFTVCPIAFVSFFPTRFRCLASALIYSVPSALLGGATPLIAVILTKFTGVLETPGIYLSLLALVGVWASWRLGAARSEQPISIC